MLGCHRTLQQKLQRDTWNVRIHDRAHFMATYIRIPTNDINDVSHNTLQSLETNHHKDKVLYKTNQREKGSSKSL